MIISGTRDLLLSNAVRLQRALRAAGVDVDLQLWEARPHGLGPSPETQELAAEMRRFVDKHWRG